MSSSYTISTLLAVQESLGILFSREISETILKAVAKRLTSDFDHGKSTTNDTAPDQEASIKHSSYVATGSNPSAR